MFKFHCQDRSPFRYNRDYSMKEIREMETLLNIGKSLFLSEGNVENRQIHYIVYKNIPIKVVYDYVDHTIITVLPFDTDEYNKLIGKNDKQSND